MSMDEIVNKFALFSEKFTQLSQILGDRRSRQSRQISTLMYIDRKIPHKSDDHHGSMVEIASLVVGAG